jgi:hypothetical protein
MAWMEQLVECRSLDTGVCLPFYRCVMCTNECHPRDEKYLEIGRFN